MRNKRKLEFKWYQNILLSWQYDPAGWAPKEYNPDEVQQNDGVAANSNTAPQAGFVWDEASGYYYDAVSGFYYDGHRGKL